MAASASRRWWVLVILGLTQLVVVLDGTIVNIALPQAQQELGLSDSERQWVVTAYALTFGALLLLGGRVADYWGRKRTYLVGMAGFAVASAVGGFAGSGAELIIARGFQGLFAALMAPAALALLTVTFPSGRDRNTAFAVFGSIGGAGAAVGLILGGVLTEFADWRWCLWVNVPVILVGLIAGVFFVTESRAEGDNKYDILGTITVALGLGSLVYGFTLAEDSWVAANTIGFIAAGVVLLLVFVWVETRVAQPLLPLRVVAHRVRGGAFIAQAIAGSVMIGAMLYLTFHLQIVLGFTPLEAGLASLPLTIVIMIVAPTATKFLPRIGARTLMIVGPIIGAVGLLLISRITVGGSYFSEVLPGMILLGIGMAMLFVPVQNLSLTGVSPHDAGAASATANAAMQIGGSLGLSIFTTLYAGHVGRAVITDATSRLTAFVGGYSVVFVSAAISLIIAAIVSFIFIRGPKDSLLGHGE